MGDVMTFNEFIIAYKSKKGLLELKRYGDKLRAYSYWRLMGEPNSLKVPVEWISISECEFERFEIIKKSKNISMVDKIINHFNAYGQINKYTAYEEYGCKNLYAIIPYIKKKGFNIKSVVVHDGTKKYTKYVLNEEVNK